MIKDCGKANAINLAFGDCIYKPFMVVPSGYD